MDKVGGIFDGRNISEWLHLMKYISDKIDWHDPQLSK